jgi:hypothetical protein
MKLTPANAIYKVNEILNALKNKSKLETYRITGKDKELCRF